MTTPALLEADLARDPRPLPPPPPPPLTPVGKLLTASLFLVPWAGSAALDVGYDHVLSDDIALGVRARCGALGFTTSDEDGHTATMNVTELSLAVHLSAF